MTTKADEDWGTQDTSFGSSPINEDGTCPHMVQLPNTIKGKCLVPARADVGKHFLMTGGSFARKEKYEDLVSRATFFQHFYKEFSLVPQVLRLFGSTDY